MPIERVMEIPVYNNEEFRMAQVKKYYIEGPSAFGMLELMHTFKYCDMELSDDAVFHKVRKEQMEKWSKEHPVRSKVFFATKYLHEFANQHFNKIMGGFAVTVVFFYPFITGSMQLHSSE